MKMAVKVFVVREGQPVQPAQGFEVDASTRDACATAAAKRLTNAGNKLRSIRFSGAGLLAYVNAK